MTNIASGNPEFVHSLMGKINAKYITFCKTYSGLGLLILKAHEAAYAAIANDSSSLILSQILNFLPQNQTALI